VIASVADSSHALPAPVAGCANLICVMFDVQDEA
jgi:hypothetical protein